MECFYYFLFFSDGEKQEIYNQLAMGDIIDMNGNVYLYKNLDPYKMAYRISSVKKDSKFKETYIYYRFELLNRDEVNGEIEFQNFEKKKKDLNYDEIFNSLEKKLKKRK